MPEREATVALPREELAGALEGLSALPELRAVRQGAEALLRSLEERGTSGDPPAETDDTVVLRLRVTRGDLGQVMESQTLERARHYLRRMTDALGEPRTAAVNDINLNRWKEYDHLLTDSLWIEDRRDRSGAHAGWYWGNFIPQIPHQLLQRYTRKGDWVLDTFVGSGTTLIECRRLERNGIGVELNPEVASRTAELVAKEPNPASVVTEVLLGNSMQVDVAAALAERGARQAQLVLMHPPYHDIIRFSDSDEDLSNAASTDAFVDMLGSVVDNVEPCLEPGRYLALVIGDKFTRGEWIPLGFRCMQAIQDRGFQLKSIVVKNFDDTRGKRNQEELWRYRALAGGFYIFKHEYLFIFRKPG